MNKSQLVSAMAEAGEISKAQAAKALDGCLDGIIKTLVNGEKVTLVGFGTFSVTERAARTGRNPRTNEEIQIPSKRVCKFKPGQELSSAVSG